jgi:hypothetical protein
VEDVRRLDEILAEAEQLSRFAKYVVIVPKDPRLARKMESRIPGQYLLGYSCPTKYGGTKIPPSKFQRPVHILGGRPDVQRRLAEEMAIHSFDCNRFTIDAAFGDFFDGERFRPLGRRHNYRRCIELSLEGINSIWLDYKRARPPQEAGRKPRGQNS